MKRINRAYYWGFRLQLPAACLWRCELGVIGDSGKLVETTPSSDWPLERNIFFKISNDA